MSEINVEIYIANCLIIKCKNKVVRDLLTVPAESLCCVLEIDTLSAA